MKGISKKMMSVLICVLFLTTIFAGVNALKIENENKLEENVSKAETGLKTETVTLYRHGLDGSVESYEVEIEYKEGEDVDKAIADKCEEKFLEDSRFMNWLRNLTDKIKDFFNGSDDDQNDTDDDNDDGDDQNDTNDTQKPFLFSGGFVLVKSIGKGFHFKPITRIMKLLKAFIPFRVVKFVQPFIFCRYNNEKAKTTLTPLVRNFMGSNASKTMTGIHSTLLLGFAGWATWSGFTSGIIDLLPKVTFGISNVAMCRNRN